MSSSDVFQNLSDSEVKARYDKYKAMGLGQDEIFDKIHQEDCIMDEENAKDIFTPNNTRWEIEEDDYGHTRQYLVYTGSMEELSEETGIDEDTLYEMLGEYEDESLDLADYIRQVEHDRKGQY